MLSFSQRDPRWANILIGKSRLTIGRYGCTITSIADLSTYFGDNLTPDQINGKIRFTPDGLVIWASCVFGHFLFERREYGRNDREIAAALAHPDRAVILQVANKSHWVVASGFDRPNKLFRIADPWLGDRATMARYKNDITGAAYFTRL